MTAQGWQPLSGASEQRSRESSQMNQLATSPFGRFLLAHAASVVADAWVAIALADSLFFSISPDAAREKILLYLLLTMAPFAVVAPFLGPILDRYRGSRKLIIAATAALRAIICLLMAGHMDSVLLFPEAFCVLVLQKSYAISRSAVVPSTLRSGDDLVQANSRVAVVGAIVGLLGALPGVGIAKLFGSSAILGCAFVVYSVASVFAFRMVMVSGPSADDATTELAPDRPPADELVFAATSMALLRALVGFMTFLVLFGFKSRGVSAWWYGLAGLFSVLGSFCGNAVTPKIREKLNEERILQVSLVALTIFALVFMRFNGRLGVSFLSFAVGFAASSGRIAFDAQVQQRSSDAHRGRTFSRFETQFQIAWVVGSFLSVVIPVPLRLGMFIVALTSGFAAAAHFAGPRAPWRRNPDADRAGPTARLET